jgi:hypothetical protein
MVNYLTVVILGYNPCHIESVETRPTLRQQGGSATRSRRMSRADSALNAGWKLIPSAASVHFVFLGEPHR